MSIIVPIVVFAIICVQILFFVLNLYRMYEFKDVFKFESSWRIDKNEETGFVCGIEGSGNRIFSSIKLSINKYLSNNSGSVIDFHLLKDAADRHCDSVENDISTQTPIPLYCGLAGTMAGVILGLIPLISSGALIYLLGGELSLNISKEEMDNLAASGINELLAGVAWAMAASICGIMLTTINSLLFKSCKLKEENGKSTFLAWMQSRLLPELPSDTSDALNRLVKNLNIFNRTFAENTSDLKGTLIKVNDAYKIQSKIIQTVHDMDVMKMAKANVRVLEELQQCTDKLELFNSYLDNIHGYTDAINTFTALFQQESNRLHVLEEIQQFFMRHKAEIAKDTADADVALKEALSVMRDSTVANVEELNKHFVTQSETFKRILQEEKEAFEELNNDIKGRFHEYISENITSFKDFNKQIKAQFNSQMQQNSMLMKNLEPIANIPVQLDNLFNKMEQSNSSLAKEISQGMDKVAHSMERADDGKGKNSVSLQVFPSWINWVIVICIIVMALACVINTVYNMIPQTATEKELVDNNIGEKPDMEQVKKDDYAIVGKDSVDVHNDTISNTRSLNP
jgi:ABC-type transporter Mla subunit MlaD